MYTYIHTSILCECRHGHTERACKLTSPSIVSGEDQFTVPGLVALGEYVESGFEPVEHICICICMYVCMRI
jgi:hypothetical protein